MNWLTTMCIVALSGASMFHSYWIARNHRYVVTELMKLDAELFEVRCELALLLAQQWNRMYREEN